MDESAVGWCRNLRPFLGVAISPGEKECRRRDERRKPNRIRRDNTPENSIRQQKGEDTRHFPFWRCWFWFFPFLVSFYQVSILTSALMFVILGLGLNIVIGYGGLLHLGYAAFYAVGAYNYGLMYLYWGIPFWAALPMGALSGMVFGLFIGFPVLRLRGDYLAIVTLAFGEIVRLLLENLSRSPRARRV